MQLATRPLAGNRRPLPRRRSIKGLSLVELMVGIAIGLFILTVAAGTFVTNIANTRKILLEARVNQELRTAMDVISRDLRRGAYWGDSLKGTVPIGTTYTTFANPYSAITATGTEINYSYSKVDEAEDNVLKSTEKFGIKLNTTKHAIQMYINDGWETLTNTDVVTIPDDGLTIVPTVTAIDIRRACAKTCTDTVAVPTSATENCPRVAVRAYDVTLKGTSKSDPGVTRVLHAQVRVRNDELAGVCPA